MGVARRSTNVVEWTPGADSLLRGESMKGYSWLKSAAIVAALALSCQGDLGAPARTGTRTGSLSVPARAPLKPSQQLGTISGSFAVTDDGARVRVMEVPLLPEPFPETWMRDQLWKRAQAAGPAGWLF